MRKSLLRATLHRNKKGATSATPFFDGYNQLHIRTIFSAAFTLARAAAAR